MATVLYSHSTGNSIFSSPIVIPVQDGVCLNLKYEMKGIYANDTLYLSLSVVFEDGTTELFYQYSPWESDVTIKLPINAVRLQFVTAVTFPLEPTQTVIIREIQQFNGECSGRYFNILLLYINYFR